jgi:hypothetical protein
MKPNAHAILSELIRSYTSGFLSEFQLAGEG